MSSISYEATFSGERKGGGNGGRKRRGREG